MRISHYSFGKIIIDGTTYASDVIIFPDHVDPSWWRQEGHLLRNADLTGIIAAAPPVLVIGTGFYGAMKVPDKTIEYLKEKKIETFIRKTAQAVDIYNDKSPLVPVIAALHLTC